MVYGRVKINIDNGQTWTYGYDHRNQLVWAELRTEEEGDLLRRVEIKYDAWGNRVEKTIDSNGDSAVDITERYAIDQWKTGPQRTFIGQENADVWADLDGSNDLQTRYLRGNVIDQLFARIGSDDSAFWLLTDRQGSVRDVIDDTGDLKDSITYGGFGELASETNSAFRGRYTYTGRELDTELDLQYNRARYYDASTGRWISQDPLGFDAGDGNLYRYVRNSFVNSFDSSGLQVVLSPWIQESRMLSEDVYYYFSDHYLDSFVKEVAKTFSGLKTVEDLKTGAQVPEEYYGKEKVSGPFSKPPSFPTNPSWDVLYAMFPAAACTMSLSAC